MLNRIGAAAPILYLMALGIASVLFADAAWKSITSYRTPYAYDAVFPAGRPLTENLVLLVLDGLRNDRAAELEHLQRLSRRGSSGSLRVGMPSLSNPSRATMVTGAWPEVSGVTNNSRFSPPPIQSLFSLAKQRQLSLAVFGSKFWERAFGDFFSGGGYAHFEKELHAGHSPRELVAWQQDICAQALEFLAARPANFTVVGITAGDEAGHDFGGASDGYRIVTAAVDACIGQIVSGFDESTTTFVAVSDHGHIDRRGQGGHGGSEPEVVNAPVVLAGKGIRANGKADGLLVDLAPTVSALLGLPIPANSQGRVLLEALDAPQESLQAIRQRERRQQESLTAHLPDRELALSAARHERAPAAALAGLWFLFVLGAASAGAAPWRLLAAVALYFGVYYALFFPLGLGYSLSMIVREEYLNSFFLKNILLAAAGYGAAVVWLAKTAASEANLYLRLSLALTSILGLIVTWAYFESGLLMRGLMPDLAVGFKAYLDLLAIFAIAVGAGIAFFFFRRTAQARTI